MVTWQVTTVRSVPLHGITRSVNLGYILVMLILDWGWECTLVAVCISLSSSVCKSDSLEMTAVVSLCNACWFSNSTPDGYILLVEICSPQVAEFWRLKWFVRYGTVTNYVLWATGCPYLFIGYFSLC